MERKEIIDDLFPDLPRVKPKKEKELYCGSCMHFPFTGKQIQRCGKVGFQVNAADGACIHFKKRARRAVAGAGKQATLPRDMWRRCSDCNRWLKTAESIREGVGHGCLRKREKGDK